MTCEWCAEPTDETGRDNACGIAHCGACLASRCRYCQDDMAEEAEL